MIAKGVVTHDEHLATDMHWSQSMLASLPKAMHAHLYGIDRPVLDPAEKGSLHARTGAVAVDIESHIAGRMAREHGIPFAAMRVVVDPCHRPVPHAAVACQRADGTADIRMAGAALLRQPQHLPAMLRLGVDAWTASRALLRCRRQLGQRFAFVDLGQHLVDVT